MGRFAGLLTRAPVSGASRWPAWQGLVRSVAVRISCLPFLSLGDIEMCARLFKDIEFARWARKERLTDQMLQHAADEIERGLVDARLGGFLLKKRIARPGGGKRGGYRTIVAYRQGVRLVFLFGFAKNESENITRAEQLALSKLGDVYMAYDEAAIERMVHEALMNEVVR
jgi:hypothetical protein